MLWHWALGAAYESGVIIASNSEGGTEETNQYLGWDASNVQAGASERSAPFNARRLQTKLTSLDGSNVTA